MEIFVTKKTFQNGVIGVNINFHVAYLIFLILFVERNMPIHIRYHDIKRDTSTLIFSGNLLKTKVSMENLSHRWIQFTNEIDFLCT